MALQGIQLPSIAGVLSFKDFSNQLNNANAGVKNVANYLLNEASKDNEREYQAEQAEKQRDWQAEQSKIQRDDAWQLQNAKFRHDNEMQQASLNKAAADKKKVADANVNYVLSANYDKGNKASMLQAQNNIWKAMQDAKEAGYTIKELEPLGVKANQLQSEIKELDNKAEFKKNHDAARSRIMEAINAGADDAAMDIIGDNADYFDQAELDEFQKRISKQKEKENDERYWRGVKYREQGKKNSTDAFGDAVYGG